MKNSAKLKIESKANVFSLTINKCDHPDVGTYRVHIDNGIDHTDQTAKLHVGGWYLLQHSLTYYIYLLLYF